MTTMFFGPRWDAPIVDPPAEQVETPVGQRCYQCREPIEAGDRGLVRVCVTLVNDMPDNPRLLPVHTECDLRTVIGHELGVCPCAGYGSTRADALTLLARLNERRASGGAGPL